MGDATPLFERALGEEWERLHPMIRERYGLVAGDDREAVGTGTMAELSRSRLALPVLYLGTVEDFLFPEGGTDVPFTITTEAFVDDDGNEALFLEREFETDPPRTFVDTLRWNPERGCITDLFGRNGRVVADLHLAADGDDLTLSLGGQWLRVAGRYIPQPPPFAVDASLRDEYDEEAGRYRVSAEIAAPVVGRVFTYRGGFRTEFRAASEGIASTLGGVALPGG